MGGKVTTMAKSEVSKRIRALVDATKLLVESGVCPKSPRVFHYWWDTVQYAHKKGYLYLGFNGDDVDLVGIGFRTKSVDKYTGDSLPEKESGDILYVPVLASKSKDKLKLIKMLRYYMSINKVNKIAYRWRGNERDLRIRNLNNVRTK